MNNYTKDNGLRTTQNNIVIPTGELIKIKGIDLRVLACVSAISNVDDCRAIGSNIRYCDIEKLNENLNDMCILLGVNKSKLMKEIRYMVNSNTREFYTSKREYNGREITCITIDYVKGGFITIEYEIMEKLVSTLGNNAFKLYVNLLWLCKDNTSNKYVERQLTQEFLLGLIGFSKTSTKSLKKAEDELVECGLIEVRIRWETELNNDLTTSTPITKKYYKIVNA